MKFSKQTWSKAALIAIGFLIGDAINHVLQAYSGSPLSPHGVPIGVGGNWVAVIADLLLVAILFKVQSSNRQLF